MERQQMPSRDSAESDATNAPAAAAEMRVGVPNRPLKNSAPDAPKRGGKGVGERWWGRVAAGHWRGAKKDIGSKAGKGEPAHQ